MNLREIYSAKTKRPIISFEIFPPKGDEDGEKSKKLFIHLELLKKYSPAFVSLTYGAGGTSQASSLELVKRLKSELSDSDFNKLQEYYRRSIKMRWYFNCLQLLYV